MSPQLFGQALLRGLVFAVIAAAGFLAWLFAMTGELSLSDQLLFVLLPTLFISGFLSRLFDENKKNT